MRITLAPALAGALVAGLLAPASGIAVTATIRVEGASATLVPQRTTTLPDAGTTVVTDDLDGDAVTVPARSATAQLRLATREAGLPLGFDIFDFGPGPVSFTTVIGPDATPSDFSSSWRVKVNHAATQVGADEVLLAPGDEVLWSFGDPGAPELDVTAPAAPVAAGTPFTVTVRAFDNAGVATPAAGATVRYGPATATADASGRARLSGDGAGPGSVTATAPGAVRDAAAVCSYAADPSACGLPAVPIAGSPSCRAVPARPSPGPVRATPATRATLIAQQRIAQAAIRRANAVSAWLDAGIVGADICPGAFGARVLGPGITPASGGAARDLPAPSPRSIAVPAGGTAGTSGVRATAAQATINRAIAVTALRRANAVRARLGRGLTGGDVRDGEIGSAALAPGLQIAAAIPAGEPPAPSRTAAVAAGRGAGASGLGPEDTARTTRIAIAAMARANAALDRARAGLTAAQFRDGAITAADLAPELR